MFDKAKQLGDLMKMRQQAVELQKKLAVIMKTVTRGKVTVRVSGDQRIQYIEVDGVERKDIAEAVNEAMKEVQKDAAKKMMEEGGGLGGLLSNIGK